MRFNSHAANSVANPLGSATTGARYSSRNPFRSASAHSSSVPSGLGVWSRTVSDSSRSAPASSIAAKHAKAP